MFSTSSTGASNDIEQATKLARAMITRYGMSKDFDMVALETVSNQYLGGDSSLTCSMETQTAKSTVRWWSWSDRSIRRPHPSCWKTGKKLDELAKYLYEKETITGEEFMEILEK